MRGVTAAHVLVHDEQLMMEVLREKQMRAKALEYS